MSWTFFSGPFTEMNSVSLSQSLIDLCRQFIANRPDDDVLILVDDSETAEYFSGQAECLDLSKVASDLAMLGDRRWPLVCLLDPQIDPALLTILLARLRDLHADQVLHFDRCSQWSLADSLALGFSRASFEEAGNCLKDDDCAVSVFNFELRNYKRSPDWLNAKNWANPELWGKHHW